MPSLRLNNPPLICVAARVQFALVAKIEDYLPDLQEALRLNGYPLASQPIETDFWHLDPTQGAKATLTHSTMKRWDFANLEKSVILRFDRVSVTIIFTNYSFFENARKDYDKLLNMVASNVPDLLIQGVELRYISHIPVPENQDLSAWVKTSVLGVPNVSSLERVGSASVTEFRTPAGGRFIVRCSTLGNDNFTLPTDLLPIDAELKCPLVSETPFILLENHHIQPIANLAFSAQTCLNELNKLREANSEVFETTVTPTALSIWK